MKLAVCTVISMMSMFFSHLNAQTVADMVANNLFSIESYRGQIVEEGVLLDKNGSQVTNVLYQKLWKTRAEIVEPASMKGALYIYDGSVVTMWFPQELFGLRIRGANPPTDRQVRDILDKDGLWYMKNYAFSYVGKENVARRPSHHWKSYPTQEKPYLFHYESWMDERYTIPLKVAFQDKAGHPWYSMKFTEIAFDVDVPENAFEFEFPQNAVVFEWDLADPGQPLDELRKTMNFEILLPTGLPKGHKIKKIINARHHLPVIVILMNNEGRWLSLTESRRMPGVKLKTGIPVKVGEVTGFLHFSGSTAMISWNRGNTAMFLIGNFPHPELISIAASVGKK